MQITLTDEQAAAYKRGEAVTIQPPTRTVTVHDVIAVPHGAQKVYKVERATLRRNRYCTEPHGEWEVMGDARGERKGTRGGEWRPERCVVLRTYTIEVPA